MTFEMIAGLVIAAFMLFGAMYVDRTNNAKRKRQQEQDKADVKYELVNKQRRYIASVLDCPNTVPRVQWVIDLIKSANFLVTQGAADIVNVALVTPDGMELYIHPAFPGESAQERIDRTLAKFRYWLEEMPEELIMGTVIMDQSVGSLLEERK